MKYYVVGILFSLALASGFQQSASTSTIHTWYSASKSQHTTFKYPIQTGTATLTIVTSNARGTIKNTTTLIDPVSGEIPLTSPKTLVTTTTTTGAPLTKTPSMLPKTSLSTKTTTTRALVTKTTVTSHPTLHSIKTIVTSPQTPSTTETIVTSDSTSLTDKATTKGSLSPSPTFSKTVVKSTTVETPSSLASITKRGGTPTPSGTTTGSSRTLKLNVSTTSPTAVIKTTPRRKDTTQNADSSLSTSQYSTVSVKSLPNTTEDYYSTHGTTEAWQTGGISPAVTDKARNSDSYPTISQNTEVTTSTVGSHHIFLAKKNIKYVALGAAWGFALIVFVVIAIVVRHKHNAKRKRHVIDDNDPETLGASDSMSQAEMMVLQKTRNNDNNDKTEKEQIEAFYRNDD